MSADLNKRKAPPSEGASNAKRKKGGTYGRWKTPHQAQVKALHLPRGSVEPGDVGLWVTCARGMEGKAARELQMLFDEYAEKMYGIQPVKDAWTTPAAAPAKGNSSGTKADGVVNDDDDNDDDDDIEASVQREIAALRAGTTHANAVPSSPSSSSAADQRRRVFTPLRLNLECLLFTKTRPPVDPVALAHRICEDAARDAAAAADNKDDDNKNNGNGNGDVYTSRGPVTRMASRYLNRLTPITASARATDKGIVDLARQVLTPYFTLKPEDSSGTSGHDGDGDGAQAGSATADAAARTTDAVVEPAHAAADKPAYSFAIRISIRHHQTLKRGDVIERVAALIDGERHKVNLDRPDKVILVDIFKFACGMSVVDGDWAGDLKKYNLSEIYNIPLKSKQAQDKSGASGDAAGGTKAATKPAAAPAAEAPTKDAKAAAKDAEKPPNQEGTGETAA
ncbi:thump domain containing protein [Niveomyces insectorum RCEF 264]|uniref:Thump domain containing protein n=1 Tax=Niveomyces insectorum RCEF 264 TaxID=1081102 RepID=A0A162MD84_9HYPO|nr:thump domain containing protein [Niveomyces insectorum RCEF 264]